ncbi:MAG TPA: ThiF family adenylyltransferase [Pyrinomonadaceae bacterium]|nr:ThiF family adenylyltransferase [Pyrinomonadaceae bacterium]
MINNYEIVCQRWSTAEAFYEERDHRTKLEVENLHAYVNTPVEIHVSPHLAGDVTIQRMALLAANLTARWARSVRVLSPSVYLAEPLSRHGDKYLSDRILREMSEADPFGKFTIEQEKDAYAQLGALRLFVGPPSNSQKLTESDYVIDALGWSALGYRGTQKVPVNLRLEATAPTAALSASIGAGDLFKRAIGHPTKQWLQSVNWCTWHHKLDCLDSHPAVPGELNLGKLLVAGVGAVGSALLYTLGFMFCAGEVTVMDRDNVETSNLNRSPLFTAAHAASKSPKTRVASDFLASLGIESNAVHGTWREQGTKLSEQEFDVWISLTNEDGAWAEVPFQLPPIVLHGTTTSGWGIGLGRHIPRKEDCTACRLPRPHEEFRGPCAEGEVILVAEAESTDEERAEVVRVTASLPFLSAAAAAVLANELMKLNFPEVVSLPNSVSADFQCGLRAIIALSYSPTEGCSGCQIAWIPLWNERRGRGRYAKHSAVF